MRLFYSFLLLILSTILITLENQVKADECECPIVSPPEFVCAEDGKTYDSACRTECYGTKVKTTGRCPTTKPQKSAGLCSCTRHLDWVCGTDGKTYGNVCEAECVGVKVQFKSKCQGDIHETKESEEDEDIEFAKLVPCICPKTIRWVCGVNGRSYPNQCMASKCSNVTVQSEGKCPASQLKQSLTARKFTKGGPAPPAKPCTEIDGKCEHKTSESTNATKPKSKLICMCPRYLAWVCGSDGITYMNDCKAECAGTEVESIGKCGEDSDKHTEHVSENSKPPCVCPKTNRPVCGIDGKTYTNECFAKCADVALDFVGRCANDTGPTKHGKGYSQLCFCDKMLKLVCGTNEKTYTNECFAKCEGVAVKYVGQCSAAKKNSSAYPCVCPKMLRKVCGTNGKTYTNECFATCAGVGVQYKGQCTKGSSESSTSEETTKSSIKPCICPKKLKLVCGSDWKTYGNDCLAKCVDGVEIVSQGACSGPDESGSSKEKVDKSKPKECICTREFKRVCGSNGKTYSNPCLAECEDVKVVSQGACPSPISTKVETKPKLCFCAKFLKFVCGNDGKTYTNECEAECAGATVQSTGKCVGGSGREMKKKTNKQGSLKQRLKSIVEQLQAKSNLCICPKTLRYVCGVDGKTYSNDCKAKCAEVAVASRGKCVEELKTNDDTTTSPDKPCICKRILRQVCGSNGKTYSNQCTAECDGVTVTTKGKCPVKPESSENHGSSQEVSDESFDRQVSSGKKTCTCTKEIVPVCGTDGKTYFNKCAATCADVPVKADGACTNDVESLKPRSNGSCVCPRIRRLVCGYDEKTYSNPCLAKCAGVLIAFSGKCGNDKSSSEVVPLDQASTEKPSEKFCVCPKTLRPVCGSDGKTYSNKCLAECKGVEIKSNGKCHHVIRKPKKHVDCDNCPLKIKLVCGSNGQTYVNKCRATCDGVQVVSKGAC